MQITNLSNLEYHKSPRLSASGLKQFAITPAHYQQYINSERKQTDAMTIGTLCHTMVFDPEKLLTEYATMPAGLNLRTNQGKADKAQFELDNIGKTIITDDMRITAESVQKSVTSDDICRGILSSGIAESSYFWTDDETGIECKCRPDWINWELGIMADLKTCTSASPSDFQRQAWNLKYHIQAAFYLRGVYASTGQYLNQFIFIAVEKDNEYLNPVCYLADQELLQKADDEICEMLRRFAECQKTGIWPGYGTDLQILTQPNWVK